MPDSAGVHGQDGFYKDIVNQIEEGILVEDERGHITFVNPALEGMLGYRGKELIGKFWTKIVPRESQNKVREEWKKRKKGEKSVYHALLISKTGEKIPVIVSAKPIFENNRYKGAVSAFTDVTKIKRLEETLKSLNLASLRFQKVMSEDEIFNTISKKLEGLGMKAVILTIDYAQKYCSEDFNIEELSSLLKKSKVQNELMEKKRTVLIDLGAFSSAKIKRLILSPIIVKNELFGILGVGSDSLSKDYIEGIKAFANQVATALENARLYNELKDSEERYKVLFETTNLLSSSLDVDLIIKSIGDQANKLLKAEDTVIYAVSGELLRPIYSNSPKFSEQILSFKLRLGEGLSGHVAETGKARIINYDEEDEISVHIPGTPEEDDKLESLISAPLRIEDRVVGVITLSKMEERFNEADLKLLQLFANQASLALERAELISSIKQAVQKYKGIVDNANDAIYVINTKGEFEFINKKGLELIGYKEDEVIGKSFVPILAPESREITVENFKRRIRGESVPLYEISIISKDGKKIPLEVNAIPLRDGDEIVGELGIARDLSEKKRAEQALKESEWRYRTLFESTGTATVVIEDDTTLSLVNTEFEKLSGYSKEEIEGKMSWTQFVLEEDLERMRGYHHLRRKDPKKAPRNYEFRFVDRHGRVKDVYLTIEMIPGTKKSIASLLDLTERKQTEEKYRTLTENINAGIYRNTPGPEGKFIEANPAIIQMFGYTNKEEFLRIKVSDLYQNPGEREKFDQKILKDGFVKDEEILLKKKDGTPFWGSVTATVVRDEKGNVRYYDGIIEDITERKRLDEQLIETNKELEDAISNLRETVSELSVLHETSNALRKTMELDEVLEIIVDGIVRGLEFDRARLYLMSDGVLECRAFKGRYEDDVRAGAWLGMKIPLNAQSIIARTAVEGRPILVENVDRDERISKELIERFGKVFKKPSSLVTVPIFALDELLGVIVVDNIYTSKSIEDRDVKKLINYANQGGLAINNALLYKKTKEFSMELEREVERATMELRRAYDELKELDRMKNEFISNISHELRSPLTAIKGFTSIVVSGKHGEINEQQQKDLETVRKEADKLMRLIDELLDFSRIESGKLKLKIEPFSMTELVRECVESCKGTEKSKRVRFELKVPESVQEVHGDRDKIAQVITNLLDNAVKFSCSKKSKVTVEVLELKDGISVKVIDRGIGIPKKDLQRVFERFYQVDSSITREFGGSGLGLAIAKSYIDAHGGVIWAESKLGKGSVFQFILPLPKDINMRNRIGKEHDKDYGS